LRRSGVGFDVFGFPVHLLAGVAHEDDAWCHSPTRQDVSHGDPPIL
jgi:hypothetical protein